MTESDLKSLLLTSLGKYAKDKEALANATDETDIRKDLKIKSARLVDVILDLEVEMGVEIEPDDIDEMFTIGDAVKILKGYADQ